MPEHLGHDGGKPAAEIDLETRIETARVRYRSVRTAWQLLPDATRADESDPRTIEVETAMDALQNLQDELAALRDDQPEIH